MNIRKAKKEDFLAIKKIATNLKEWFTSTGVRNLLIDCKVNNVIVAVDKGEVVGFLCYHSQEAFFKAGWMAVARKHHRKGIGKKLVEWLIKEAKHLGGYAIQLETEAGYKEYKPYLNTVLFFKKLGFKESHIIKTRKKGWDDQLVMDLVL